MSVVQVLALIFILDGITNIGIFNLQKNMQFDKEFLRQLLIKVSGFLVTIPMAFFLRDYWAMIYGMIASTVCAVLLSYKMQSFRPRLSLVKSGEMLRFSSWLQVNNFLTYANEHTQNIVVSKLTGTGAVGILSLSRDVGTLITVELLEPINRAAYPAYAKSTTAPVEFHRLFFQVFGVLALMSFPMGVGVFCLAHILVPLLLGDQWLQAIPVIQLLALASISVVLTSPVSYLFLALARQKMTTLLHTIRLLLLVSLLIPLVSSSGTQGAAMALFVTSTLMLPLSLAFVSRVAGIDWRKMIGLAFRPTCAVVIMYFALNYAITSGAMVQGGFLVLFTGFIGLIMAGAMVYLVSILLVWYVQGKPDGPEALVIDFLKNRYLSVDMRS